MWDVGGQKSIRTYWRNYFESTDGIIWVVDRYKVTPTFLSLNPRLLPVLACDIYAILCNTYRIVRRVAFFASYSVDPWRLQECRDHLKDILAQVRPATSPAPANPNPNLYRTGLVC